MEQTLSIIKPDAVERNLVEEIKNIFTKNSLNIKEIKKIHITKDEASNFIKFINQNPSIMIYVHIYLLVQLLLAILEGKNAVISNRKLMGATNPKDAEQNTIRKLYGISIDKNSVHGSDLNRKCKKRD